jgi:two-component system OmpR family response regulator
MSTILIVDDDPDVAGVFKVFLEADGHTAVTAEGGIPCLKLLQEISPDLILLDLMMQPMDGWTTLKAIKSNPQTSPIPVVMITGKPQIGNERETYSPLYYDYLLKPIRKADLCDAVKKALGTA